MPTRMFMSRPSDDSPPALARSGCVIPAEQKLAYAGIYVLKKMDIKPEDGGLVFPVILSPELEPLDELLQDLALADRIAIDRRKARWVITRPGYAYIGALLDEAAALVEEFDDQELPEVIAELRRRNLDVFRARFLWGWYEGEFDDLILFQERRGVVPVEHNWADYLLGDAFYNELARDTIEETGV